jgi:hypothetical protein
MPYQPVPQETLGSDQWLQSRESGVCPSRSRKVNVGQAISSGI